MLASHKSKALAVSVLVCILSITSATDVTAQVAVPAPVFSTTLPNFTPVTLPLSLDQIASTIGLHQMLPKLVLNDANLAYKLGFSSIGEISLATIGQPLPVYIVKLDDLKNLTLNQDAYLALLKSQGNLVGPLSGLLPRQLPARLLYPILVGGKPKSCMELVFSSQRRMWRINTLGMPKLCLRVQQFRKAETNFVLRVPALNRDYLGSFDPPDSPGIPHEALGFIALFNDTIGLAPGILSLAPGNPILGSLFFTKLKDEAINVNPQLAR